MKSDPTNIHSHDAAHKPRNVFSLIIFKVHIPILLKFLKNSMWQVVLCTARSVGAGCGKENFKAALFHTCPILNCIQIKTFASECVKVWLQQQPGRVDICILYAEPQTVYSSYPTHLSSWHFAVRYIFHIKPREAGDLCLVSVSWHDESLRLRIICTADYAVLRPGLGGSRWISRVDII